MTERYVRMLKMIVLFLVPFHSSFATIYYVNINNPTPGTGTSWSSAFTDLNAGIAAASGVFDQLWVAKGTYKPTTTTSRSATFNITGNLTIYGGFNGTETAYTQANPTANPTILSGDIGVIGDPSDNCYHVITYTSADNSNLTMDGFIITGGNANNNYPAVASPSADNTGGGFLEVETNGNMTSAAISHCNFVSNFAVYGGGLGEYGDASTTFYSLVYCKFSNNEAYCGGGIASLAYNVNWSHNSIDMCTFVNNTSDGNLGSAISTMNTNGTAGYAMYNMVTNCVFYNNPQPQLYNQSAAGTGSLWVYCSIIWNSIAPYPGPLYAGNSVLLDYCDLDLVTPLSDLLDVDPQFTNAAAGDFHTPHCSPLIDQGFTTAGFNIGTTDPDGNPRLLGPKTDIGLYESNLPPYPTVTNLTYCQYATAAPLTATPLPGYTLLWYPSSTGGTGSPTAPIPSTATSSPWPTYYYVGQVDPLGCPGPQYPIQVTVNAAASEPSATAPSAYCLNDAASTLSATGTNLLWYTAATGGTGSTAAPTPTTTIAGTTPYYVTQTPSGTCESGRLELDVTVKPGAAQPAADGPIAYCQDATATPLTASGSNLLWYNAATGGTGSPTAPTPITSSIGSTSWFVSQTPAGACESPRSEVDVTVKPGAAQPGADGPIAYCQDATATPLTASGSNLLWYTAATGGTGSPTAPTPTTSSIGSTSWFVSQTPAGACESPRSEIDVTIKTPSSAPSATNPAPYCQNTTASALTATGINLLWYNTSTGGTGSPAAPSVSTAVPGAQTYYVSQTPAGSCESDRTPVTVTINPNPKVDFSYKNTCPGTPVPIETNTSTGTPDSYTWDFSTPAVLTGSGAGPYEVSWNSSGDYPITLTTITGTCQNQVQHNITVYAAPNVEISPVTGSLCVGKSTILDATGASTYVWSPATNLSDATSASPMATLDNNIVYTVTGTDANGCIGTAQLSLEISPDCLAYFVPNAFTPNGDGNNDLFHVKTGDAPKSFIMQVFNRYGGKVFESRDIAGGWNGTIGGNQAPTDTYVYTIQITTSAGTLVQKKGTVMLIR